ncbi:hypothetical protein [Nocardia jinanensis]|uniref:Uncharacterized protein n=1 Tax=Nocardia jinanensis TaxID=382504 RepID=A0A917RTF2_9NOCA|nr:hypothetical protein [Nocardia jinanensis]GGL29668.1 hypothetical protein GCM10011588_50580 [Nocardia jinanensis]
MEAQVNAWIIVAVALVAAGLLISVILWLRTPGSGESEYVTVAELRARLEHEQEPDDQAEHTDEREQPETDESAAESAETSSTTAVTPEEPADHEPGARPAEKSTTDTPGDEPEILGRPTQKAAEEQTPETEEPPSGEADRNH